MDSLSHVGFSGSDAPNEFLALSNEVAGFRQALAKVEEARQSGEISLEMGKASADFDAVLERASRSLQDVDILAQKVSKQRKYGRGDTQVSKLQWLKKAQKANKLQEALRAQKSSLCNIIVVGIL